MFNPKRFLSLVVLMFFVCGFAVSADATGSCGDAQDAFAEVMIGSSGINFMPKVSYGELIVTVARADGSVFQRSFDSSSTPYLSLTNICGSTSVDGTYNYELRLIPAVGQKIRGSVERAGLERSEKQYQRAMVQTGSFSLQNGAIVPPSGAQEGLSRTQDVLHYDDVIITGSLCIGFDCANGESFGYCTMKLKENNLQICFEDTSVGSFPTNDWKIQINDTTSGGASYFTLWDTNGGRRPFTIEAGAPAHSLYVEDYGRVGLGTSIPYVELHIVDGDSPTIRLDQDGSSGWAAQRWDLCGNETNFFIRDVTNGSKLCFRIQPSTPSNTLCMRSTGYVGIGTWSPAYLLEVEDTGANVVIVADRTDGATTKLGSTSNQGQFGTISNHPLKIVANNDTIMSVNQDETLDMSDGGSYDGTWNDASSRKFKENIKDLTVDEAMEALNGLNPVKFNYKIHKEEEKLGFIAEDVPDLVATNGRENLSAMDIVAVLTKVVKEQQETISELKKKIAELEKK
ncbi:MAG: tail fiber domain-containing protein [Candidatus Aminicenantes bacterium]|jgi:hypothetical protein